MLLNCVFNIGIMSWHRYFYFLRGRLFDLFFKILDLDYVYLDIVHYQRGYGLIIFLLSWWGDYWRFSHYLSWKVDLGRIVLLLCRLWNHVLVYLFSCHHACLFPVEYWLAIVIGLRSFEDFNWSNLFTVQIFFTILEIICVFSNIKLISSPSLRRLSLFSWRTARWSLT